MSHPNNHLTDKKMKELLYDETMIVRDLMRSLEGDELSPMLVLLVGETGHRMVVSLAPVKGLDKHQMMFYAGQAISQKGHDISGAILIAEAWAKEISKSEAWRAKQAGFPRPSKCPDRIEIVSITLRGLDGRGMIAMSKIAGEGAERRPSEWTFISPADYAKSEDNMLGEFFTGYGA